MDTRSGNINLMREGETLDQVSARTGIPRRKLIALGKLPDPKCYKCSGTGAVPNRKGSREMKPCACTEPRRGA